MLDFFTNLWNKNKILFWILIPLVIIAGAIKLFLAWNAQGAVKDVQKATKKDKELKEEQDKANNEANKLKTESDTIENQIKNNDPGLDWHKGK